MRPQSSSCSLNGCQPGCRVADVILSDQFPAGLRVLVVDDDPTCLRILNQMLRRCMYEVTSCSESTAALKLLREKKGCFDVVLSDVHMPDVDGFELLELVGLEMDLPVIMMSADGSTSTVFRGIKHGACDYLIKPIRMEQLKIIWKHVVCKKCNKEYEHSVNLNENDRHKQGGDAAEFASSVTEGSGGILKTQKKRRDSKEEYDSELENDDPAASKKPRVVWSVKLHQQFVNAVNQLGIDKAVPKRILELMNVPGLTRENVASHLQKFRLYLKRLSGAAQQQGGPANSFCGRLEQNQKHGSLGRFDIQALTASGQIPPQTLAALQAELLGRPTSNLLPPTMDQSTLLQAPLQGPTCIPVDQGVSYGQPLKKPIISTEDGKWPSNNLGTVGPSGNLGEFSAQTGTMLMGVMQNPQQNQRLQQHREIILPEPSCLVVPTQLSSNFQTGNSPLPFSQNGRFDTVIDYSLVSPQLNNSLGQNPHGDFLQGSYSADSNQVFDMGMLRNLGFVGKGVSIPSRFAVDEPEQQVNSLIHENIYAENDERKVKHAQNMEFIDIDKTSAPMLQHFSHNNLMSAFSDRPAYFYVSG